MKAIFATVDAVPEPLRPTATKREDGRYELDLTADPEGFVDKARLDEFRENNVRLMREREELVGQVKRFEGIDPDKAREAEKKLREMDDQKLISEGKIEELLTQRTERMRQEYEQQVEALKGSVKQREENAKLYADELTRLRIEGAIIAGCVEKKVLPPAHSDAVDKGLKIFRLSKDGKAIEAYKPDGSPWYGKSGTDFITIGEWLSDVAPQTSPHWWGASHGQELLGNAGGGRVQGGVITLTQTQAKDVGLYRAARDRATKEGLQIQVVADNAAA